ncbi:MAG TPA: energy-coupling factor transporter transmembrane component T [Coriobacteriia bacterium]|nr:energy-coupling factor transporter transmembrane component T [Coriobacteriia bacterium]
MAVPIPFGQYVALDSPVHRIDARVKIVVTAAFAAALFAVSGWTGLAIAATVVVATVGLSRVPFGLAARGLKPIAWLLAFTIAINALFPAQRTEALFQLGKLAVDAAGLKTGLFFGVRILLLVLGSSLVTLTTSPVALTDGLAQLMRPLGRMRFPVDDAATMMSIALRFMPTTAEEAERIVVAQTARGARFDVGGPITRAKAWIPVLVPLFVRLFRRADELAIAMEARCYRGEGRTRLRQPVMRATDWAVLASGVAFAACVAILL